MAIFFKNNPLLLISLYKRANMKKIRPLAYSHIINVDEYTIVSKKKTKIKTKNPK